MGHKAKEREREREENEAKKKSLNVFTPETEMKHIYATQHFICKTNTVSWFPFY